MTDPVPTLAEAVRALLAELDETNPTATFAVADSANTLRSALATHDAHVREEAASFDAAALEWLRAEPRLAWTESMRMSLAALLRIVDRRRMERDVETCRGFEAERTKHASDLRQRGDCDERASWLDMKASEARRCAAAILAMPVEGE